MPCAAAAAWCEIQPKSSSLALLERKVRAKSSSFLPKKKSRFPAIFSLALGRAMKIFALPVSVVLVEAEASRAAGAHGASRGESILPAACQHLAPLFGG